MTRCRHMTAVCGPDGVFKGVDGAGYAGLTLSAVYRGRRRVQREQRQAQLAVSTNALPDRRLSTALGTSPRASSVGAEQRLPV